MTTYLTVSQARALLTVVLTGDLDALLTWLESYDMDLEHLEHVRVLEE